MKRQVSMSERVHPYSEEAPLHYPSVEPLGNHHDTETLDGLMHTEERKVLRPDHHTVGGVAGFDEEIDKERRRQKRRRRCCVRCCCCVGACVGTLLVIIGILVLVFFLVLHPKLPKYTITDASISRLTMSNSSSSSSSAIASDVIATAAGGSEETAYLNVDMELEVRMGNPNKKIGIDYRAIDARLLYEGVEIGEGSIPRFYQGHKNVTHIGLTMQGRDVALTPAMSSVLRETLRDEESITLHARTIVHVRIKIGSWTTGTNKVRVKCSVQLTNPARGTVRLLHNSCKFKLLRLRL